MDDFIVPRRVFDLLQTLPCRWGVAGGWAVDLFLDTITRDHQDIEVAILREDQQVLRDYLSSRGWSFDKVVNGGFQPWLPSEQLSLPIHEIWGYCGDGDCRNLEVLLNECSGQDFVFRRNASIRLPFESAFVETRSGIPVLAPEIVMLYKSRRFDQPKEQADLGRILPALSTQQRGWLFNSIAVMDPAHPWLQVSSS